jgi:transcriptional regulator with XRE-family HTH domain
MTVPTMTRFNHWKFVEALQDPKNGMEPQELANEMGASVEAVARWMAGIASPKAGYATQAARILKVSVDDFYGDF